MEKNFTRFSYSLYNLFRNMFEKREWVCMQRIEVSNLKDLLKMEKIKGNETLYVKVKSSFKNGNFSAIDMQNFSGNIYLSFENPYSFRKFQIQIYSKNNHVAFFEHITSNQVCLESNSVYFSYQLVPRVFKVQSEQEFWEAIKKGMPQEKIEISLQRDLIITKTIPKTAQNMTIFGNNHRVFCNKSNKVLPVIRDAEVVKVDQIVSIHQASDWKKLEKIHSGLIVASLENDISNFEMKSISLAKFTGSLLLLGNSHTLKNGVISSTGKNLGMISEIHPYANLYVSNLVIDHVLYQGSATHAGSILGSRGSYEECPFASFKGCISIQNCHIEATKFLEVEQVNPFVGNIDEFVDILYCTCSKVLQDATFLRTKCLNGYYVPVVPNRYDSSFSSPKIDIEESLKRVKKYKK